MINNEFYIIEHGGLIAGIIIGAIVLIIVFVCLYKFIFKKPESNVKDISIYKESDEETRIKSNLIVTNQIKNDSVNDNKDSIISDKNTPQVVAEEKKGHPCLITFISFIVLVGGLIGILWSTGVIGNNGNDSNSSGNGGGGGGLFQKAAPTISVEQTLTGLIANIDCNDNYSYVIITIIVYDKNDEIIKEIALRGDDYKKGGTYQIKYTFSVEDALKARQISYRLSDYS